MFLIRTSIFLILFLLYGCKQPEPWVSLLQENSLEGWEIKNGYAPYHIQDGEVIGTTVFGSPNTFLCTTFRYSDFILEFEVNVDSTINSGVQFRTNNFPNYREGVVHGYQAEIDPSERAWSGGIYDESRRGWLYTLENHKAGRKAFKNNEWNHYRIEAIGNKLMIWVNHINTANLEDEATASGFIGLQVHSIADSADSGKKIRWRNLQIITENVEQYSQSNTTTAPLLRTTKD